MKVTRIRNLVVLLPLAAALFSCSRYIDSDNPVRSIPTAPPTPINVSAKLDNSAVTLSWELTDSTKATRFRIYTTDANGANASLRDSTTTAIYTRTISGLLVNQRYFFSVATIGTGGIEGERSAPYGVTAGIMSIAINGGKKFTNSRDVSVTASVPQSASHIMLSESPDMTGASFEPFQNQSSFQITDGDGLKRIYARFIFSDGTQSGSPVVDSIKLDTKAQIDSVYFSPAATTFAAHGVITFSIKTGETGGEASVSFTGSDQIRLYDDGAAPDLVAADGIYAGRYVVPTGLGITAGLVTGAFTDAAGNQAAALTSFQTLTITTPAPKPVVLAATTSDTLNIKLTWSQNSDTNFALYRLYRSADTTVAVDTTNQLVTIIGNQGTTSYDDVFHRNENAAAYRIFVFDKQGKAAGSNKVVVKK